MVLIKGIRFFLSSKKMWGVLQKKISNLGYSRRVLINLSLFFMVVQKLDYFNDFIYEILNIQIDFYESMVKIILIGGFLRDFQEFMVDNFLNQFFILVGQLFSLLFEN